MIKPEDLQTPEAGRRLETREAATPICATTMGPFVCQMPKGHRGGHGSAAPEPKAVRGGG